MPLIPQSPSSYNIEPTCQIENLGLLLEQLPKPFGIFNPNYLGRFVEVGAFDGKTYSNVWSFIEASWAGIMIEPMPENFALMKENLKDKPWIIMKNVACGEKWGAVKMFFEREGSREAKPDQVHHVIRTVTLDSILHKHRWTPNFDILVIDTEDMEKEVLAGFTLSYWKPLLAIIETHAPLRPIVHDIFDKDYSTYSEDGLNTLFTRRDWKS